MVLIVDCVLEALFLSQTSTATLLSLQTQYPSAVNVRPNPTIISNRSLLFHRVLLWVMFKESSDVHIYRKLHRGPKYSFLQISMQILFHTATDQQLYLSVIFISICFMSPACISYCTWPSSKLTDRREGYLHVWVLLVLIVPNLIRNLPTFILADYNVKRFSGTQPESLIMPHIL